MMLHNKYMNDTNNTVEFIGYYGGDITHACSAWTSTNRELTPEKIERIPKLLKMLAENGHHTPFEKSSLHFLVNTDVATHIHFLKHRISVSINGESARYKELKEDKYYMPEDWGKIECSEAKGITWLDMLETQAKHTNLLYHLCVKDLTLVLGRKRAKESARFFKMYNSQIQADVMFNWRSFNHFLSLRHKENAQKEIYDMADKMLTLVKNIEGNPFKYTLEAFGLSDSLSDKEIKTSVEEEKIVEQIEESEINEIVAVNYELR